jgi:hypothetical protein
MTIKTKAQQLLDRLANCEPCRRRRQKLKLFFKRGDRDVLRKARK